MYSNKAGNSDVKIKVAKVVLNKKWPNGRIISVLIGQKGPFYPSGSMLMLSTDQNDTKPFQCCRQWNTTCNSSEEKTGGKHCVRQCCSLAMSNKTMLTVHMLTLKDTLVLSLKISLTLKMSTSAFSLLFQMLSPQMAWTLRNFQQCMSFRICIPCTRLGSKSSFEVISMGMLLLFKIQQWLSNTI